MSNVASAREVSGAQAFLRYLGADWHDNLMILAIVAWFRQESGSLAKVIGNNPFNIRDSPFEIGTRQSRNGNGHFAVFANLDTGFKAAAYLLKSGGNDWRGYGAIVAAAKRNDPVHFLIALALSAWDAGHYGTVGHDAGDVRYNHLLRVYASFTGLVIPPAGSTSGSGSGSGGKQPKPPKAKPAMPRALKVLPPAVETNDYLQGFAARSFYDERHRK